MSRAEPSTINAPSCLRNDCSLHEEGDASVCPTSGTAGLHVGLITVKALLKGEALRRLEGKAYYFCPEPTCNVVYFDRAADSVYRKEDMTTRIGEKESEDPIPICYCFDVARSDLRRDLMAGGKTAIPAMIAAQVKAGHCACEVKNPRGICCLGNVTKAVSAFMRGEVGRADATSVKAEAASIPARRHRGRAASKKS